MTYTAPKGTTVLILQDGPYHALYLRTPKNTHRYFLSAN